MKKLRLIDTGINNAPWNMSIDEALLYNFKDDSLPILRLYQWENSLSFGRFSKVYNHISKERLTEISYVRRVTGGGILVHGGDISYSIILPKNFVDKLGIKKSYLYLCSFLIHFYKTVGFDAKFAIESNIKYTSSDICLNGNEPYDIVINNKKIGGNAQRYSKQTVFQHGMIPMNFDENIFEPLFLEESGLKNTATLSKLGFDESYDNLKKILLESFSKSFSCELLDDDLNENEIKQAKELFKNKYSLDSWNIDGKIN